MRNSTLSAFAGAMVLGIAAMPLAQAQEMTAIGHRVHQSALTGETGGNIAAEWSAAHDDIAVNWLTFDVQDVHERLFREASLSSTSIDIGFAANRYYSPAFTGLFEPLDDYLAENPIENFDEIPQGMLDALTYDGKLYGIPFRHATPGLHINTAILEERGLEMPETFEDVLALARELTFTREDGTEVYGLLFDYRSPAILTDVARAMSNGDFLTNDFELRANSPEMIAGIQVVADLYEEGVLPEAFINFKTEDLITYMQQGRAAMAISPFGRYNSFNNPEQSQVAGDVVSIALPKSESLEGYEVAPVRTEFWAMVIPQNSQNKDLAWDFIVNASSVENTIRAGVNGNGPIRPSAYEDERIQELVAYSAEEQAALAAARPPMPGFAESARAEDIFIEEIDTVFLGLKSVEDAMNSAQQRIEPLLPN